MGVRASLWQPELLFGRKKKTKQRKRKRNDSPAHWRLLPKHLGLTEIGSCSLASQMGPLIVLAFVLRLVWPALTAARGCL